MEPLKWCFASHTVVVVKGIIIGSILSIISFALVIFVYERSLPKPESIEPPNDHELAQVAQVIKNNIGGDD